MGVEYRLKLDIKPLSINQAFKGKRYKTDECKAFDKDCQNLILQQFRQARGKVEKYDRYEVQYDLYLVHAKISDWDNCIKVLQDNLVNAGLITDDRKIYKATVIKHESTTDYIEVHIKCFDGSC